MRKRRILSLLLAVAVTATMLIAVPLTASAAEADNTWDAATDSTTRWAASGSTTTNGSLTVVVLPAKNKDTSKEAKWNFTAAASGKPAYGAAADNMRQSDVNSNASKDNIPAYNALKISVAKAGTVTCNIYLGTDRGIMVIKEKDGTGEYVKGTCPEGKTMTFDGSKDTAPGPGSFSDLTFDAEPGCNYYVGSTGSKMQYASVKFEEAKPGITLGQTELKIAPGGTAQLTATKTQIEDTIDWTVESDTSGGKITVDGSDITATVKVDEQTEVGKTATIKATAGEYSAECSVTVSDEKTISIKLHDPITNLKLKQGDEVKYDISVDKYDSGVYSVDKQIKVGTYNVEYTNAAPMSYDGDGIPATVDVKLGADASDVIELKVKNKTVSDSNFSEDIYEAIKGKSVTWGAKDQTWYPSSMGYLYSIQSNNIVRIAGSINGDTEDSIVYMTVQGGKINTEGRNSNFQYNDNTKLTIPVVPGSTVKIVNYTKNDTQNKKNNVNNAVYTITDSTGFNQTYGSVTNPDVKDSEERDTVYEQTHIYKGAENGYVTITATDVGGGYLSSITVDATANPKDYFGKGLTDSGWYQGKSGKEGVIRFLQKYVGNSEVDSYGIYFIDPKSNIEKAKISGSGEDLTESGIYADLYGISEGKNDTYSAKAFVEIGGKYIWSDSISGSVSDWSDTNKIDNYKPGE